MDGFYIGLIVVGFVLLLWYLGVFDKFLNKDGEDSKKGDEGGAPSGGAPSGGAPSGGAPSGGAPSGGAPVVAVTPVASPVLVQPVVVTPVNNCGKRSVPIRDLGYASHRGWYDTENCGKKNRYCRWVGGQDGGDPSIRTQFTNSLGKSYWSCSTPTDQYGYNPPTWNASYLRSATEEYP